MPTLRSRIYYYGYVSAVYVSYEFASGCKTRDPWTADIVY